MEVNPLLKRYIPLVDYNISWACANHNKILMSWAFYFGGGEEP